MSRGFVKEDDQEEAPFIPPRAPLPDGATNHVTPRGMRLLLEERTQLEQARANAQGSDDERRRAKAEIDGRLALLNERIVTARPVEQGSEPPADVRFGVLVKVAYRSGPQQGMERSFTVVGVDEASVAEQRFASPHRCRARWRRVHAPWCSAAGWVRRSGGARAACDCS